MGKQTNTCPITGGQTEVRENTQKRDVATGMNLYINSEGPACTIHVVVTCLWGVLKLETWVAYYCCVPSTPFFAPPTDATK